MIVATKLNRKLQKLLNKREEINCDRKIHSETRYLLLLNKTYFETVIICSFILFIAINLSMQ
jgi:hypothetical protein